MIPKGDIHMPRKIWARKTTSFADAQAFDDSYYLALSASERLETVQFLREEFSKLNKGKSHESGKRLRRVLRLIEQK